MKHLLIFLLILLPLSVPAESFYFSRLDNTKGLSNNQIESIFRDSRGFMWFGTNFGLNRYDGYRVRVYKANKNDTTSLLYNAIPEIQEDVNGDLWIRGNPDYVVYSVRRERFVRQLGQLLRPMGVHFTPSLVEIGPDKSYYFCDPATGIYKYIVNEKKLVHYPQSTGSNGLSMGQLIGLRATEKAFWVLHSSGLLERFNESSQTVDFRTRRVGELAVGASVSKNLFIDREGCPWVFPGIGDKGVLYYNFARSEWQFFGSDRKDFISGSDRAITTDFVRDVEQDDKGRMWIATDHGGINIYNKESGEMTVLLNDPANPNSISQNSVISLHSDSTGIMWVGTYKNGVSYYHPGMFKFEKSPLFFFEHPLLENKDCNTLLEDSKGNLWIGTNGSGLLRYNKRTGSFRVFRHDNNNPSSLSSDIVISALEDHAGVLWFGTFMGGLNRYDNEQFVRYQPRVTDASSLSNKSIYGIVEDPQHRLWIGTLGGGVDMLNAERTGFTHFNTGNTPGLSSDFVLSMSSAGGNPVYLSTASGIDLLNTATMKISPVFADTLLKRQLADDIIIHSLVDTRNLLWIATDNGINVYDAQRDELNYIGRADGLPSEQVVSFVEDRDGNVWVGTRNGLACVYIKRAADHPGFEFHVAAFDHNDGLVNSIFNQNAVYKSNTGEIFFGGTKGYMSFNPSAIRFNTTAPVPRITGLQIGNEEIMPAKKFRSRVVLDESVTHKQKLVLHYNEKNFTLSFSALSYIHPEKNHYRYMLKGLDEEWIESPAGVASYSNLGQGSYELIVYASNNDNVWSKEPLVLEIVVKPPFWFSWWAFVVYGLAVLYLVRLIVRWNLRKQQREFENEHKIREAKQLHEMDEMKFRFFTNISHEFRTPLSLIINPVEKLKQEIRNEEQAGLLEIIHRNASNLLELVNQLLDFRKLDVQKDTLNCSVGDVVTFVRDICYSFTELATKKSVNFLFSSSLTELRMEFDPEKLRKIVYNLLSNAFKFTPDGGKIEIQLSLLQQLNDENKQLKIVVSDTGIGIPEKDRVRIFERFYRVENADNSNHTGTGVGLHIVSEYVSLHGGEIVVESEVGKGSIFTVLLPARQQVHQEVISRNAGQSVAVTTTPQQPETPEQASGQSAISSDSIDEIGEACDEKAMKQADHGKQPLMLIVDDNDDFRNFIVSLFRADYRILSAEDGEKALKLTLSKLPDLIISDVMMPVMDGYEFCRRLKADIRTSHIPVILLTAKTGDENKYIGLEAGAEDYISKPFRTELLTLKVSRIVDRQKQKHDQFRRKVAINPSEIEITSMDEKFVKKAVALVEANIGNTDFLVEDLCREMAMSRVYFYKKILSLTDKTPSEFIRFIRLKRAADLLEKSQLFVNEVAYQVGFNDPKYFRKYFKEEFGMSPNEYKKQFD